MSDLVYEQLFATKIVGSSFYEPLPFEFVNEETPVWLTRNPNNAHDKNAIEVHLQVNGNWYQFGHLRAVIAADLAPKMDNDEIDIEATVCSVTGGGELKFGINLSLHVKAKNLAHLQHLNPFSDNPFSGESYV